MFTFNTVIPSFQYTLTFAFFFLCFSRYFCNCCFLLQELTKVKSSNKAAFIMYATGGGGGAEDFFFSGSFFYIPPPRSIQIFRTPQAISRKINTPLPPPKKYQNKYLYNSKLYMFEISRDKFNKNIERALTVYVIPMPASLSSAN